MPDQILINDFSAGWIPSDSHINGRKNGLLMMDNLELDENGALVMIGGCSVKHTGFTHDAHTLYSRVISGSRKDYNADVNGGIFRNTTSIGTGGSTSRAAFGDAFDFVLACSGNTRKKDNGTTAVNLGILPPTAAPTVVANASNAPYETLGSVIANIVTPVGTSSVISSTYLQLTANASGKGVVQSYASAGAPYNANTLEGVGGAANIGFATDNDYVIISGYLVNPFGKGLEINFLVEAGNSSGDPVANYYKYVINDLGSEANFNTNGVFSVKIRRGAFERIGPTAADWSTIYGFRITFSGNSSEVINILGNALSSPTIYIIGGSRAQDGQYQYMQLNVNNTGSYLAKSILGPISGARDLDMIQALITPQDPSGVDAQCNEVWIFRRGGLLGQWYRVLVFTTSGGYSAAYDTLSDLDAIKLNIIYNDTLVSIASGTISDAILGIVGPIESRWLYFTDNYMYPSDINNPDLVDPSRAVKLTGSTSEKFLWAYKVGDKNVLVGTTCDIYILTGTFITQPDFTIDLYYDGVGCEYPPISLDACESDNSVFYLAKDGWRVANANGVTKSLVAPNTDLLYDGQTRYGYSPPSLTVGSRFPVIVGKNKLWCFITGTNRCEVYDFTRQYWRTFNYGLGDVTCAFSTQDGFILAFYGTDNKIREIDISTSKLIDAATQQTVTLLTLVHDNGTARQRKDSYNLKARIYTGATGNVAATVYNDQESALNCGTFASPTAVLDNPKDISTSVGLTKTYQIKLTGQCADFKLADFEFLFDTRPPQVSFLRVLANNFNTSGKKKIPGFPFQIDTLGNNVTLTPVIDASSQTGLVVNNNGKKTFTYQFSVTSGNIPNGVDYEFTIAASSGLFEWFGFQEPRDIEIFPQPNKGYIVPTTNLGSPNKKRLRVWPFELDALGQTVTYTPVADGTALTGLATTFNHTGMKTVFAHFTTDVFAVDYGGYFSSSSPFELRKILPPDIVQILPIAKRFDQVGPSELFKFGKMQELELRVLPFNSGDTSSIPFIIYYNDNSTYTGTFTVINNKENSYFAGVPKGTSGNIVRIELGPTTFDFHRFYMRAKCVRSGKETETEWITLTSQENG